MSAYLEIKKYFIFYASSFVALNVNVYTENVKRKKILKEELKKLGNFLKKLIL